MRGETSKGIDFIASIGYLDFEFRRMDANTDGGVEPIAFILQPHC